MARESNIQGEFFFHGGPATTCCYFSPLHGVSPMWATWMLLHTAFRTNFQLFQDNTNSENDLEFVIADIFCCCRECNTDGEFKCMAFQVFRFSEDYCPISPMSQHFRHSISVPLHKCCAVKNKNSNSCVRLLLLIIGSLQDLLNSLNSAIYDMFESINA